MALFINFLALALPIFILQVYGRMVFYQGLAILGVLIAGVAIAISFDFILRQARARLLQRVAVRIDARLGEALFDKLISLPLRVLESWPTIYWQVLFRDVDTVRNTYCGSTALLAADLPFVALFLVIIFVVAEPIAWVIVSAVPIFLLLAWRFRSSPATSAKAASTVTPWSLKSSPGAARSKRWRLATVTGPAGRPAMPPPSRKPTAAAAPATATSTPASWSPP